MQKELSKENIGGMMKMKWKPSRIFEKALSVGCISLVMVLLTVQGMLINGNFRTYFTHIDQYEGIEVSTNTKLYAEGEVTLELMDQEACPDIKVMVNGVEKAQFTEKQATVPVYDGSIVQMVLPKSKENTKVRIVWKSKNVLTKCVGNELEVREGITTVLKTAVK